MLDFATPQIEINPVFNMRCNKNEKCKMQNFIQGFIVKFVQVLYILSKIDETSHLESFTLNLLNFSITFISSFFNQTKFSIND